MEPIRRDRVRQIHTLDRPRTNIDRAILVTGIEPVARLAVVLEAQRHHVRHHRVLNIHNRQRVVLLQRHPRPRRVIRHRNVFRLEILRRRCARAKHAHPRRQIRPRVSAKIRRPRRRCRHATRQINDTHRTFRIDTWPVRCTAEIIVSIRLSLICHQQPTSIGAERHHVRQCPHQHRAQMLLAAIKKHHHAGISLYRRFHRHCNNPVFRIHAVDHLPVGRHVQVPDLRRMRRVMDI